MVTTMVMGNDVGRHRDMQGRWRATLLHGGVVGALCTGLLALWVVAALVAALLTQPAFTLTTLERDGARGVPVVVRQGTSAVFTGWIGPAANGGLR